MLGVALLSSGCETLSGRQQRERNARMMHDIANLKISVSRLESRLEGIEAGREDIYAQLSQSERKLSKTDNQYRAEIAALENKLAAQEAARERMRKEVVADLSTKMEKIIKSHTRTSSSGVSGVEHTVKPGQTLSEIAKAYGVKTKTIIKVNRLKNPDDLRVGQKLIIPD